MPSAFAQKRRTGVEVGLRMTARFLSIAFLALLLSTGCGYFSSGKWEDDPQNCLDQTLFWTTADLEAKLNEFQKYFNEHRTHAGIKGRLPDAGAPRPPIGLSSYGWQRHCRRLYQTPIGARF